MFTLTVKTHRSAMLALPLGSRHHLGHGAHEVFARDGYGVDVKHELLRRRVDLRVATSQRAQGGL